MIDAAEYHNPALAPGLIAKCTEKCGNQRALASRLGVSTRYLQLLNRGDKEMSYGVQVMLESIRDE